MEEEDFIFEQAERYLNQQMTPEEKVQFEKEMEKSPELQEFIAMHRQVDAMNDEGDWVTYDGDAAEIKKNIPLFEAPETREFAGKLMDFRSDSSEEPVRRSGNWVRWAVISGVAASLILALFVLFPKGDNMDQLYAEYSTWTELPSLAVKGDPGLNEKAEVEQLFLQKKYPAVITKTTELTAIAETPQPALLLYQGVAQLELDQFENALQTFTQLTESNTIDHHKGYWYMALVHLKQGNKEALLNSLKTVASNPGYYRHTEAKELLEKLE